jgi:hypothetical protein
MKKNGIVRLNYNRSGTAKLLATSCWHYGNRSVSDEGIHRFLQVAKKHPWLHHGDIIEGIMRSDRRFSIEEHKDTVVTAMGYAIDSLGRAKKTCVGLLKGNHDETPSKEIGDVSEYIANSAGVPYRGGICWLDIRGQKGQSRGVFAHGSGGSNPYAGEPERRQLNREIWLRNRLQSFDVDIAGIGHVHRFITCPPCAEEKLSINAGDLKRLPVVTRPVWYYAAPSMFKTYSLHADTTNYAEMKLYGATDIGWIEMVFDRDGKCACIREVYGSGKIKQERYPRIVG